MQDSFSFAVFSVVWCCRLEGLLYATGIAYSEDAGVLLDDSTLTLALAFTDAVPKLASNMFTITGPKKVTMTELEHVDGSDAYWTFSATVPEDYYGKITVTMNSVSVFSCSLACLSFLCTVCTPNFLRPV